MLANDTKKASLPLEKTPDTHNCVYGLEVQCEFKQLVLARL